MNYKIIVLFLLIFTACQQTTTITERKYSDINGYTIKNINNTDKINIPVNNFSQEAYLIFTNKSNLKYNIQLKNKNKKEKINKIGLDFFTKTTENFTQHASQNIIDFNHSPIKKSTQSTKDIINYQKDNREKNQIFYLEKDCSISTKATIKKTIKNIQTKYGYKTLNIWVSDDSFGEDCSKAYCIEQYMIDALANTFLREGKDNDIYDWVSNIFGEEWGDLDNDSLIDNNNEITILLTDIDNDNRTGGGVLGYFYAKDNYKKRLYPGSNEQTMFYIDSVVFATHPENQKWDIEEYRQQKILSTLAHEFEHMIQFYQKNILYNNSGLNPWIDEMLAVTVEDIIATKLKTNGLRGVPYTRGDAGDEENSKGRFPLFNKNISLTLPKWNNKREDYSKVGAFGSYLIRNYGGAKLLHDILHNKYTNEKAIVHAIQKSPNGLDKDFNMLMHDWGIAILLSSSTELGVDSGYLYNLGDFLSTEYQDSIYSMGSINFFNYTEQPHISTKIENIETKSNLYYKINPDSMRDINITINNNSDIMVTLIVKNG